MDVIVFYTVVAMWTNTYLDSSIGQNWASDWFLQVPPCVHVFPWWSTSWTILGFYIYSVPRPVCCFWDSVPIGSLWRSCSYQVCFPWWLRQGAMDPYGGNPRWENVDRSALWIYTFILVIRLSQVKQSAFSSPFHLDVVDVFNNWPPWWASPFRSLLIAWQPRQPGFLQLCSRDWPQSTRHSGTCHATIGMLFSLQVFFFRFFFALKLCTN